MKCHSSTKSQSFLLLFLLFNAATLSFSSGLLSSDNGVATSALAAMLFFFLPITMFVHAPGIALPVHGITFLIAYLARKHTLLNRMNIALFFICVYFMLAIECMIIWCMLGLRLT